MSTSQEQLRERAAAGDEPALAELLEHICVPLHAEVERRIGARYRGLVEADDILQVTCLEVFLRIRSFVPEGPDSLVAWVRKVADNNLRDAIKELERDKRPPPGQRVQAAAGDDSYLALVEQIAATTTTPSRVCARTELRQEVDSALRQLPADYEQALRLYELEGLSGQEVAERMGRSHGAVRVLLARARERLAEILITESRIVTRA